MRCVVNPRGDPVKDERFVPKSGKWWIAAGAGGLFWPLRPSSRSIRASILCRAPGAGAPRCARLNALGLVETASNKRPPCLSISPRCGSISAVPRRSFDAARGVCHQPAQELSILDASGRTLCTHLGPSPRSECSRANLIFRAGAFRSRRCVSATGPSAPCSCAGARGGGSIAALVP